jgi:hypothetical protein
MIISKDDTTPSYKSAVERYKRAAGDLFVQPSQKASSFKRGAWMLNDASGLVAIVDADNVVFAKLIAGQMQKLAESFAE